ncbi:quercetin 2,3-dioxygenase [Phytohabitans sp. LJ34]|uniref:quercetin 2,3-dioxygenase n=1 Tax=Phytohabitans sp. LJ34 TaxID=3452217 RepID=UPI003F88BCEE
MSLHLQSGKQAQYVPAGEGPSVWTFLGDRYTVKASKESTGGPLGLLEALVEPGSGPPLHIHRNEDEAFYLLEGELELQANGDTFIAQPGSFIYIPRGAPHAFKNVSESTVKMLGFFLPGGFEQFFLDIGHPVVPGEPQPPGIEYTDDIMRKFAEYGMEEV